MSRTTRITVKTYLTPEEYEFLKKMAGKAGLSVSAYIRAICLGHEVKSGEDQTAILELARVSADLGRLGGLLKQALAEKATDRLRGGGLLDDITRTRRLLEDKVKKL